MPRVLVVDDEQSILTFVARVLRDEGYEVQIASSGAEARTLADEQHPFDLFIIDIVMPDMRGDELATILRQGYPLAKVLYFTGYSDLLLKQARRLAENEAVLEKPAGIQGLSEAVSLILFGHARGPRKP